MELGTLTAHESGPKVLQAAVTWMLAGVWMELENLQATTGLGSQLESSFHLFRFDRGPQALEPAHFRVRKMWKLN